MKRAFGLELLVMFFSGLGAVLIWEGNWFVSIIGFIVLVLTSYIIGELKKATLDEYIEAMSELTSITKEEGK